MKHFTKIASVCLALCLCAGCAAYGSGQASAQETAPAGMNETMFTDRDYEVGYTDFVTVTLSDGGSSADGAGVSIDGSTVTFTEEGTYLVTGTFTDGQLVVDAADDAKLQLVLDGASVSCIGGAALYIKNADKVFLTTAADSENTLASTGENGAEDSDSDGAVFAACDLTMNGRGALTVTSETGHGVVCVDDLKLTSGTFDITAARDGLHANDSIRISGGVIGITGGSDGMEASHSDADKGYIYIDCGTIALSAGGDGLHASGDVTVSGGVITIACDDDAVHADNALTISGGVLDIDAHEGLEALLVTVEGGDISILSDDDGVNASGGSGAMLTITGGTLRINSNGDSLDANGTLLVTGGSITITGPAGRDNGIIDYDAGGTITGGTVIGTGVSGMQINFSADSTQGSILYTLPSVQAAGTVVTLTDAAGNVLVSHTAEEPYQVVLISAPGITPGGTYTLTAGTETAEIEMTSVIYGGTGGASPEMGNRGF